ncbi:hemolysin-type calcium-binding repeat family protein [Synechococcus sp. MEDNS5]|uniref:calcium-binding protein n=1 Tax=Synechococcus sp. MEDNS5 TaxID=1442554 RepID=UPI0016445C2D|nr:calcium-binding protein [Synechococcus sp. MEDNS5]QNJ06496.1 hemolysin-type calcium-binding repeat family protein [Synechococcus sp. MEDNS5]
MLNITKNGNGNVQGTNGNQSFYEDLNINISSSNDWGWAQAVGVTGVINLFASRLNINTHASGADPWAYGLSDALISATNQAAIINIDSSTLNNGWWDDPAYGSSNSTIQTGDYNDSIIINATASGEAWKESTALHGSHTSNEFSIDTAAGNDTVSLKASGASSLSYAILNASVNLGSGNDHITIDGDWSSSSIFGGAGEDVVQLKSTTGNASIEVTDWEEKSATITSDGRVLTVDGFERIILSNGSVFKFINDVFGNHSDDYISTGNSIDRIYASHGDDIVYSGDQDDEVYGEHGNDNLHGQNGDDQLYGGYGIDKLYGGTGDDIIDGGVGADYMSGGAGNDTYYVDNEGDVIDDRGLASDVDTVVLQGAERFTLGKGVEAATGNSSNNTLNGNSAHNTLEGGAGNDTLYGAAGNDTVNGGSGRDTASFSSRSNRINLNTTRWQNTGDGRDRLISIENVNAGTGNDKVTGSRTHNTLNGQNGNDWLYGNLGNDTINGGSGHDTAQFSSRSNRINLNTTRWQNTRDGRDRLISIENVNAGSGSDVITGNRASNTLNGQAGNDRLYGEGGNDLLIGGGGKDRVWGQGGRDTFRIQRGDGYTIIEDFNNGQDRIQLGTGASGLRMRNRGDDVFLYQRGDLMAIVEDAAGDLQRSDNYLV